MINLDHVQKIVNGAAVLDIEQLTVEPGEIAAIVGAPGSGIDVLRDILIGRAQATAGSVLVNGHNPAVEHTAFSRSAGVLFADNTLYARRSARKHLTFDCRIRGLDKVQVDTALTEVGLADHADIAAQKLSPGLQRRLAFGRAILHDPAMLLLIDPFQGCDNATIELLIRQIKARAHDGAAVLTLTRDVTRLARFCRIIYVLERGRITKSREPDDDATRSLPLKIPVKLEDEVMLVNPADILFAAAHEGHSILRLRHQSEELPTQFTLNDLETRLAHRGFFRAHRSYLVNLQHVKSVIPYTRNAYSLILEDENASEIPLSRASAAALRELLGY
jgi:ABC-2 type transport system ATP-binding protein